MKGLKLILKMRFIGSIFAAFLLAGGVYADELSDALATKIGARHEIMRRDAFYGFDRIVFDFNGYEAWVVCPKGEAREGRPWTWTMQWATAFVPRTNVPKMLSAGFHHVTINTFRHAMDETGLAVSAAFQRFLVDDLGFNPKADLIGLSWGGFFSIRYAAEYPQNVHRIYLDAPLLTFSRERPIEQASWKAKRPADGNWLTCPEMPINKTERIAKSGIPVLLLYGGVDTVVPPETNAKLFEHRFRAAGGEITVKCRGSYAHHPHGVESEESLIMDFFCRPPVKPVFAQKAPVFGAYTSARFPLDKPAGENAYYSLRFNARSETNGYWWVDFYDKDGKLLPDVNSLLERSDDFQVYDVIVTAGPEAVEAVFKIAVTGRSEVRDIRMQRAARDEVEDWCGRTYAAGPRINYLVAPDCWAALPKSRVALTGSARRFNVVLLGDSLMNDSYCGLLGVQMQRAFPQADLRIHLSVRGSTGCGFYREEANFNEYVARHKPDLVLIGGISNARSDLAGSEADMIETIRRCQAIGAEVVICSPPASIEFRTTPEPADLDPALFDESIAPSHRQFAFERRAAAKTHAQFWDITTATYETIARSGKPLGWFNRDKYHNNDRGKQLIGQLFGEYFRAAYRPLPKRPRPSKAQLRYLEGEIMALIHYGLNTYVDREWGYGDTPVSAFAPTALNPEQWVLAAKAGGIRRLVLVAKHHDGFCLFPSALNADYTVANTSWKNGKGDIVREVRDACVRHGLDFGVYLSPWDRHQASYATADYAAYYQGQWDEIISRYGPISEIWLDGANGGDGWYGGAKERRRLPTDARTYYGFDALLDKLGAAYPLAVAFGGGERSNCVVWSGNELGMNPETYWSVKGGVFMPSEADTPFRKSGWFWHPGDGPKPLSELVEVYFLTVGRNAVLNLGLAPDRAGLIGEDDVARLKEFNAYVQRFNATDFAAGAKRREMREGMCLTVTLDLNEAATFNTVDLREDITDGQIVESWTAQAQTEGVWRRIASGTTVGYRRMERFPAVTAKSVRIVLYGKGACPSLAAAQLRFAPAVKQEAPEEFVQWRSPFKVSEPVRGTLMFDFLRLVSVNAIQYIPPKGGIVEGVPDRYEIEISEDGKTWVKAAEGEFGNLRANPVRQIHSLPHKVSMRYARVKAVRALAGEPIWKGSLFEFFMRK